MIAQLAHLRLFACLLQLAKAIRKIAEAPGMALPEKIRFFRGQMQTIITRACSEVGVEPVPSRRCIALMSARPARAREPIEQLGLRTVCWLVLSD